MTLKPVLLALAALLSSCALQAPTKPPSASALRFSYTSQGGQAIGLIRAFDDGQNTTLQFLSDPPPSLLVTDDSGAPLVQRRMGQYLVLQGLHSRLRVSRGPATALVLSADAPTPAPAAAPPAGLSSAELELRAAREALRLAHIELERLRGAPESATSRERVERLQAVASRATQTLHRVTFPFGSSVFSVSTEQERAILTMAEYADALIVRGHTDSHVSDEPNRTLAMNRALAARRWLIAAGVEPHKIRAVYRSAGGFVADNATRTGRALNRRVDIEARPAPAGG